MTVRCILLTIAFVKVSPILTADYANAVYLTNEHIKNALDTDRFRLTDAISNIVKGNANMVTISLMLAVPEKANIFNIPHDGNDFIESFPETIAIEDQEKVRRVIHEVTNTPMPQLEQNQNIENEALSQLGEERRRIIGPFAKHLLISEMLNERPEFQNLDDICRLIGLYRSIRYPRSYTRTATVSGNECILTAQDDRFRYIPYRGNIVLVRPRGRHVIIEHFTHDLLEWLP